MLIFLLSHSFWTKLFFFSLLCNFSSVRVCVSTVCACVSGCPPPHSSQMCLFVCSLLPRKSEAKLVMQVPPDLVLSYIENIMPVSSHPKYLCSTHFSIYSNIWPAMVVVTFSFSFFPHFTFLTWPCRFLPRPDSHCSLVTLLERMGEPRSFWFQFGGQSLLQKQPWTRFREKTKRLLSLDFLAPHGNCALFPRLTILSPSCPNVQCCT